MKCVFEGMHFQEWQHLTAWCWLYCCITLANTEWNQQRQIAPLYGLCNKNVSNAVTRVTLYFLSSCVTVLGRSQTQEGSKRRSVSATTVLLSARHQWLIQVVQTSTHVSDCTQRLRNSSVAYTVEWATPLSTHVDILVLNWPKIYKIRCWWKIVS
jgi:hypothetical protein